MKARKSIVLDRLRKIAFDDPTLNVENWYERIANSVGDPDIISSIYNIPVSLVYEIREIYEIERKSK